MKLSERIKKLRNINGLSQDELAKRAGVSLRTIQRIELSETEPRGDTLIRIAAVFDLKPEDLIPKSLEKDKYFLSILNLSALTYILFPLLGFIVPLILWVMKKDDSFDSASKKLLNFQITWCIVFALSYVAFIFDFFFTIGHIGRPELIIFFIFSLYIINFLFIIFNVFRSVYNKKLFYQPAIPFFR